MSVVGARRWEAKSVTVSRISLVASVRGKPGCRVRQCPFITCTTTSQSPHISPRTRVSCAQTASSRVVVRGFFRRCGVASVSLGSGAGVGAWWCSGGVWWESSKILAAVSCKMVWSGVNANVLNHLSPSADRRASSQSCRGRPLLTRRHRPELPESQTLPTAALMPCHHRAL